MESAPDHRRPQAFVIRVQKDRRGMRGQVVAVATGRSMLFGDLQEAMAFIKAHAEGPAGPAPRHADEVE